VIPTNPVGSGEPDVIEKDVGAVVVETDDESLQP